MPDRSLPPRWSHRPLAGIVALVGLLALWLVGCGDDGRPTGATHRLIIEPCTGRIDQRATGSAIAPEVVATVAHSLDGVASIEMRGADGRSQTAEVVYLDVDKDIALLRPARPVAEHLTLARPEGPGPVGVLRFDDAEERPRLDDGEILELVSVTLDGEGRRDAARLSATIEPGDSGAAVVDDDGAMVAMVFATARSRDVGWAVSSVEVQAALDALERNGPASPPAC